MLASRNGYSEIVSILLSHNVDLDVVNWYQDNVFTLGYQSGDKETIQLLFNRKENALIRNVRGDDSLHYACNYSSAMGVEFSAIYYIQSYRMTNAIVPLIELGVDPTVNNNEGKTPLVCACENKFIGTGTDSVALLLNKGVDPSVSDNEGKTPLMHACKNDEQGTDIVTLLLNKGVDPYVSDNEGKTALMYACETNDFSLIFRGKTFSTVIITLPGSTKHFQNIFLWL